MTKEELDFIGSMNMCDEISNDAYEKIVNHIEETEISDDCVSREQAIKTISTDIQLNLEGRSGLLKYSDEIKDILKTLLDSQEKKLKALPPVTPTQRWIPVSERLPEESSNYLLYGKVVEYEDNCVFIGEYDSDYEKFGYDEDIYDSETLGFLDSKFCEYSKVIAWQPLPKPYEEKRGNEND